MGQKFNEFEGPSVIEGGSRLFSRNTTNDGYTPMTIQGTYETRYCATCKKSIKPHPRYSDSFPTCLQPLCKHWTGEIVLYLGFCGPVLSGTVFCQMRFYFEFVIEFTFWTWALLYFSALLVKDFWKPVPFERDIHRFRRDDVPRHASENDFLFDTIRPYFSDNRSAKNITEFHIKSNNLLHLIKHWYVFQSSFSF